VCLGDEVPSVSDCSDKEYMRVFSPWCSVDARGNCHIYCVGAVACGGSSTATTLLVNTVVTIGD
jgi:hypothetical protein